MKRSLLVLCIVFSASAARAQDGSRIYTERCQACHEAGGAGRAPSRELLAAMPADRIIQALTTGLMREQGGTLTPADRTAVATFLSRVRPAADASTAKGMCSGPAPAVTTNAAADWNGWGAHANNDRFQRTPEFTPADIPKLKLKWAYGFENETSAATTPIVVGDRVFVGSASGRFHSLDLATGCTRWTFRADAGVRGAAVVGRAGANGAMSVFVGDGAANIYRLDANSGELKWKIKVDAHRAARISGSVVLYEDRVIVPVSSSEEGNSAAAAYSCCTFRGSVVSLDAETGKILWKTYTIPTPAVAVGKSSAGATLYAPSGAAVWHAPTIDPATGSIFIATGDAYTQPAAPTTDSIMALDIKTGAMKWSKQLTENDAWNMSCGSANPANCPEKAGPDSDFGQPPILISLPGSRRALVIGQKSGHAWAVDPDASGKVLWEQKLGKGGVIGGFEWGAGSDGTNFYAPLSDLSFNVPQMWGRGGLDPSKGGGLYAIRIADGQLAWTAPPPACAAPPCSPAQPAPPAIVPGAIFSGSLDGTLRAYSSTDGKIIWSFDTAKSFDTVNGVTASGGAIDVGGPAIAHGYVLTTSGYGLWGGKRGNVLLVFGVE